MSDLDELFRHDPPEPNTKVRERRRSDDSESSKETEQEAGMSEIVEEVFRKKRQKRVPESRDG